MTGDDRAVDRGSASADSPPGGRRGRSGLLGLTGLLVVVGAGVLIFLFATSNNAVPAPQ